MTQPLHAFERVFEYPEADPARLFTVLTTPADLELWFAERVRIEPREGGAFAFWGRFTPSPRAEGDARQRLTEWRPGVGFAFDWPWSGVRTHARITLAPHGQGGTVAVRHHAFGSILPPKEATVWTMGDFWRLSMGNLREYLRRGHPAIRPDFTDPRVRLSVEIDAPPSRVFLALTDPAEMDRWISAAARVEPRAGGAYAYGWTVTMDDAPVHCGPRTIIDLVPDRLLVTDWQFATEPVTRVRWELEPLDGGVRTRLTVDHARPDVEPNGDAGREGYVAGWTGFLLEIAQYVEGRQMTPHAAIPG